jgi:hypothetical protein
MILRLRWRYPVRVDPLMLNAPNEVVVGALRRWGMFDPQMSERQMRETYALKATQMNEIAFRSVEQAVQPRLVTGQAPPREDAVPGYEQPKLLGELLSSWGFELDRQNLDWRKPCPDNSRELRSSIRRILSLKAQPRWTCLMRRPIMTLRDWRALSRIKAQLEFIIEEEFQDEPSGL